MILQPTMHVPASDVIMVRQRHTGTPYFAHRFPKDCFGTHPRSDLVLTRATPARKGCKAMMQTQ